MLNRFRKRGAYLAAALAAFLATVGAPHSIDPRHDSDRAIVVVPHDEANHQLRSPDTGQDSHDSHCVMCHFARSFRPRTDARIGHAPPDQASAHHPFEIFRAWSAAPAAQPPLRSPPASPFSA
jgi:hypothetical protein